LSCPASKTWLLLLLLLSVLLVLLVLLLSVLLVLLLLNRAELKWDLSTLCSHRRS
jgi:hypothetical protein